jgi:hypothetical protein
MRWRTHERKHEVWERALEEANEEIAIRRSAVVGAAPGGRDNRRWVRPADGWRPMASIAARRTSRMGFPEAAELRYFGPQSQRRGRSKVRGRRCAVVSSHGRTSY